ncbi:MAG: glycosyltransferase family 2 protein [Saccharofermentanales bacterium]
MSFFRKFLKRVYLTLPFSEARKVKLRFLFKRYILGEIPETRLINIYKETRQPRQTSKDFKVTAVIPNYNYARYLRERVDSILLQTYPVDEIIILDDCSTDNSITMINQIAKEIEQSNLVNCRVILNQQNSGSVFKQWEKGFREARNPFIWICEADDSCSPNFLDHIMEAFIDSETVLSYCESLTMDENNFVLENDLRRWIDIFDTGHWNKSYINNGFEEIRRYISINNTIANASSVVINKTENWDTYAEIFEKAQGYRLAGDWYFYLRIMELGKVAYCAESLNYHRMHNIGVTLTIKKQQEYREICSVQDYVLARYDIPDSVRQRIKTRRKMVKERLFNEKNS